ncbi:hypothetical protein Acr_03g0014810 [Actinidia rufa]|uniref:Uncharacterized protein n=1 Tax=Actinidia rufa TaxID=165716 RepID=A0A7J0EGE2_9ERIC|nr:hypothetical protein Acr_03g0014810 [Actinidia rufa]
MELNRAQLLVHDDAALNKFQTDHAIPIDVKIEGPEPNEDPDAEGGDGKMSPYLHAVTDNPDKDLFLDEFVWVSGNWEFLNRDDSLYSFPRHNGYLPDKPLKSFLHLGTDEVAKKPRLKLIVAVHDRDASNVVVSEARGELVGLLEGARHPPEQPSWKAIPPAVKLVDPCQAYSPLVLLGLNEEGMLEEEADEIPEKSPELVGKLGQETEEATKNDVVVTKDGIVVAEDGVAIEGTFPNLSFAL